MDAGPVSDGGPAIAIAGWVCRGGLWDGLDQGDHSWLWFAWNGWVDSGSERRRW